MLLQGIRHTGGPRYMRTFLELKIWHFRGTYPLIYHYFKSGLVLCEFIIKKPNFLGPYLLHITRDACTFNGNLFRLRFEQKNIQALK